MATEYLCCADHDEPNPFDNGLIGDLPTALDEVELGVGVALHLMGENIDGAALWRELAIRGRFPR